MDITPQQWINEQVDSGRTLSSIEHEIVELISTASRVGDLAFIRWGANGLQVIADRVEGK